MYRALIVLFGLLGGIALVSVSARAQTLICAVDLDGDGAADQPSEQGTCPTYPGGALCPIQQRSCDRPALAAPVIAVASVAGVIVDDDTPPSLSLESSAAIEGTAAPRTMALVLRLSKPAARAASVDMATADVTAVSGLDYVPLARTVTFAVGDREAVVLVDLLPDVELEADELFSVILGNPQNVTLATTSAVFTIVDDDSGPVVSLESATANEEDGSVSVRVRLDGVATGDILVDYATQSQSATSPADFQATSGVATIALGATFADVVVPLVNDTVPEDTERFRVFLSSVEGARVGVGESIVTVRDSDADPLPVGVAITSVPVIEGDAGVVALTFTVSISPPPTQDLLVDYAVAGGTAAPMDFVPTSGVLSFTAGQTTQSLVVSVNGDTDAEPDETVIVALSNVTGVYGCPGNPTRPCIETAPGLAFCSPHDCFDRGAVTPGVVDPPSLNPSNNGPRDAAGNCLGELQIFAGKASRCRRTGVQTFFHNCCTPDEPSFQDSMGRSAAAAVAPAIATISTAVDRAVEGDFVGANQALLSGFDPATIAITSAMNTITEMLLEGCDDRDTETALMKDARYCVLLGTYCAEKWPLVGCVQRAESHCCFNSMLARIIHEQGRPQLPAMGGFGTPDAPNCRGFRPEEFQALDFSKIDMTEYATEIRAKAQGVIQGELQQRMRDAVGP
jgi:conjugal transfer mating pair stabilization protein TraN